jgi:hypothetical protein
MRSHAMSCTGFVGWDGCLKDDEYVFQSGEPVAPGCFTGSVFAVIRRMSRACGAESRLPRLQIREEAGHAAEFIKEQTNFEQAYFNEAIFDQAY